MGKKYLLTVLVPLERIDIPRRESFDAALRRRGSKVYLWPDFFRIGQSYPLDFLARTVHVAAVVIVVFVVS